ncbi:hypothetical protein KUTeg_004061 [Tegillarca granosa]|uniref:Uncharacterized protein n=1 Tax=Tegillarca granosa TaxID=220873 RepID=A0ABQ9FRQ4_TEGGR|nr:hypothetical protein KUTeg_004061 [Tegillarca granosa]
MAIVQEINSADIHYNFIDLPTMLTELLLSSDINFTAVHPLLHSTVGVLEDMATSGSGSYICEFLSKVPSQPCQDETGLCTFEYKGHTIRDSQQQRSEAVSVVISL